MLFYWCRVNPLDLSLEMSAAAAAMPKAAFDRLCAMGCDKRFAAQLLGDGLIGVANVSVGSRFYEPEGPDRRLLLGVCDATGRLIDIAALASHRRDEWALRTGFGALLGEDLAERAVVRSCVYEERTTLRLYANPFDWLAAKGEGLCVLDWCPSSLNELRHLGERVTIETDPGAAERLKALLAYGGLPRVRETQNEWERAA